MTTGHVFMATSLDGFVARKNHSLGWLNRVDTGDDDLGYEGFIAKMDGLIMGSGSFRTALSFEAWPYSIPVVVMSHSLTESDIPESLKGKVTMTRKPPKALMESLHQDGWKRAYVDGGKIVQSFVRDGLVSDMVVTLIPILIGEGLALFGAVKSDIQLTLLSSQSFDCGLVQNKYRFPVAGAA